MTSSETRALKHAVLLVVGLAAIRAATEGVRRPVTTEGTAAADSSSLAALLDESRGSRDEARTRARPLADDERIDPNTAPEQDLDRLPGVGPAVAARIVQMRKDGGPFAEPTDLLSVPGVGPATLARIAPHLEWRGGARPASSSGAARQDTGRPGRAPALLDLNRASRAELERLPGVGPVMAGRILAFRASVGRFRTLEELESVQGIGPATIERLRPLVITGS